MRVYIPPIRKREHYPQLTDEQFEQLWQDDIRCLKIQQERLSRLSPWYLLWQVVVGFLVSLFWIWALLTW